MEAFYDLQGGPDKKSILEILTYLAATPLWDMLRTKSGPSITKPNVRDVPKPDLILEIHFRKTQLALKVGPKA